MAKAADYFKMAAANLRHAVQARRDEISNLRKLVDSKDSETRQNISQTETTIRAMEADMARQQNEQNEPDKDRATKLKDVMNLHGNIADHQHNIAKIRSDTQTQI